MHVNFVLSPWHGVTKELFLRGVYVSDGTGGNTCFGVLSDSGGQHVDCGKKPAIDVVPVQRVDDFGRELCRPAQVSDSHAAVRQYSK